MAKKKTKESVAGRKGPRTEITVTVLDGKKVRYWWWKGGKHEAKRN
jgi:hypothetical protein